MTALSIDNRVLALWDDGEGIAAIAAQLQLPRERVNHIIRRFDGCTAQKRYRRAMARSNSAFLAALRSL